MPPAVATRDSIGRYLPMPDKRGEPGAWAPWERTRDPRYFSANPGARAPGLASTVVARCDVLLAASGLLQAAFPPARRALPFRLQWQTTLSRRIRREQLRTCRRGGRTAWGGPHHAQPPRGEKRHVAALDARAGRRGPAISCRPGRAGDRAQRRGRSVQRRRRLEGHDAASHQYPPRPAGRRHRVCRRAGRAQRTAQAAVGAD